MSELTWWQNRSSRLRLGRCLCMYAHAHTSHMHGEGTCECVSFGLNLISVKAEMNYCVDPRDTILTWLLTLRSFCHLSAPHDSSLGSASHNCKGPGQAYQLRLPLLKWAGLAGGLCVFQRPGLKPVPAAVSSWRPSIWLLLPCPSHSFPGIIWVPTNHLHQSPFLGLHFLAIPAHKTIWVIKIGISKCVLISSVNRYFAIFI